MRCGRLCWCCVLAMIFTVPGCGSWDGVRTEVIDGVNRLVHREYPRTLREQDPGGFAALHAPERAAAAREIAARLLDGFTKVAHAECAIVAAAPPDASGRILADVELRLEGLDREGRRRSLAGRRRLACARTDGEWRIVEDEGDAVEVWQPSGPVFVDEAMARGLDFTPLSRGVVDRDGVVRRFLPGFGVAVRDVDGDGLEDVLLVGGGDLRLFRNLGGVFRDESEARGIAAPAAGECRFGVFADIDNDGDGDLLVGVLDGENLLFWNDGAGRFQQKLARESGIFPSLGAVGVSFGDFDGDGDLDLFLANGGNLLRDSPEPIYDARNGGPDQFFINRGDGTFEEATERAGVGDPGWALSTTTSDFDGDGDLDLLLGNDFGANRLFRNRGNAVFDEVSLDAGVTHRGSAMGVACGDVDADGDMDIFITGMASNSAWILDQPGFPTPAPWPIRLVARRAVLGLMKEMLHGNRLYLNDGDGGFREVSSIAACDRSGWAWGGIPLDYDNDGRLDLYVANGLVSGPDRHDL